MLDRIEAGVDTLARSALSVFSHAPQEQEWILFQFYHWVLDDERRNFRRQLQFLRRYGDFIGLDDAVTALQSASGIGGRYFCVTFDDGFKNWATNAAPILSELRVPAAFFIPTKYIGLDLDADWDEIAPFYRQSWSRHQKFFEFLSWDDCRQMASAGFTIGSHTHSHSRLTNLSLADAEYELRISKQLIEQKVGQSCRHFCCPWGKLHRDYDPVRHPEMARQVGYTSFLTTEYGLNLSGASTLAIRRTGSSADQGPLSLKYALLPSWVRTVRARSARSDANRKVPHPVR